MTDTRSSDGAIADVSSDAGQLLEQAKRLHLAETLVEVTRTVGALDTLDEKGGWRHAWLRMVGAMGFPLS